LSVKQKMKLPNADQAIVEREKIGDYLLNTEHPDNGGKAAFFLALGFSRDRWQQMAAALRQVAGNCPVSNNVASPHGMKYIVAGQIETPCSKRPLVLTVWIVDRGLDVPRLVTAYPCEP
jgi:hypothetical protein